MFLQLVDPANYILNSYAAPVFAAGVAIACLGFFVLFREQGSRVGASFLLVCLSISLFMVSCGFNYASKDASLAFFWIRISHLGVVFIPSSVLLLTLVLCGLSHRYSFAIAASIGLSLLFALSIILTDLFISTIERFFWGHYPHYGPLGIAFLVYFLGISAYTLVLFWREYRRSSTEKNRQRTRGLLIAFIGGYFGAIDFLPALGITIYPFGYIPIFFFIFAFAYVVIRYQLVDITPETATGEILEIMHGGVIVTDLEGKVRVANSQAHKMLGHLPGSLLGMKLQSVAPIPDELVEAIRTGKHTSDYEMVWPGRNGPYWVSLSASLLPDKRNGELLGIVYVAYDITGRKRVEENLKESEKVFHNLFNNTEVAMLRTRVDGSETLDANDKFLELVGRTREEVIGKPSAVHWVDPRQREEMVRRLRADGRVVDIELQMFNKKGEVRDCVSSLKLYPEEGILDGSILDITERKKAEEKLKISEQQLRESQRVARIGHYVLDIQTGAWTSSEALDDIYGIGPEYVRSFEGWLSMVHPDERPELSRYFAEQVLRDQVSFNRQYRITRKSDGAVRWVHGLGNLTPSSDGKPLRMFGTIQDITERKMAEESQRENQMRLDLALQAAHMGVWRWEIKENRRYYDELTCQLLGIDSTTFNGASEAFFKVIHPDDREMVKASLARTIEQDAPYDLIYRVVWPDGSIHYVSSRSRLVRDDSGQPARLNGIIWDVTEQRIFEKELQEKEMKYRSLFESAKDGIFILAETGFMDCNQKGAEMYGLKKEELLGHSPLDFAPEHQPDGRLSFEVSGEKIEAVLRGIPQVFEWQSLNAKGNPFDVEITLSRLELGGKMYLQSIVRDIGERKRLELEHLKTQKLESIGTLAGGIAHDFNNLLQGVFGYISLARLKKDDREKSLAALEEAEKALHMTVKLTNQLLTFSKGGKPVKKTIDLLPVIENAAKFALSGSRTDFRIVADGDLWQIDADEGQIGQVIQNIVLNADQAMPEGGRVEVMTRNFHAQGRYPSGLQQGAYVEITIKDSGVGIPEQYRAKIFDPYFTTKEKGSGLGLATSYSIIKNHNGMIDVKSERGKGTTFIIYLPATEAVKREEQGRPAAAAPGRTGRVLIMDDEPVILDIAGELIRALGHSAEFASQGKEAIAKYQEAQRSGQPFDVVILDLTIRGGMGGAETLRRLTEIDPGVKAVVSSGYSDDAAIAGYLEQGFKAVLKKPYDDNELREVLNRLLNS